MMLTIEPDTFVDFHTSLYFMSITVTTIGYGDLHPTTPLGRGLMILVVFITFVLVPAQGYALGKVRQ